ncbi:MAG: hypothetical protein KF799_04285 [Bdellovibrionales bacterium]|nr:hypothetical protein [Bdellovibrionales bacterium]
MIRIVLALFAAPAFAAPQVYDIAMKLKSNGKEISAPTIVVKEGETAKLTQRDTEGTTFWEIVAHDQGDNQILLNFKVGTISNDGKRTAVSQPRILAAENEMAEMNISRDDAEVLTLSVVAKRKAF